MFGIFTKKNRCLGVDLGTTGIKIVELKKENNLPVFVNYAVSYDSGSLLQSSGLELLDVQAKGVLEAVLKQGNFDDVLPVTLSSLSTVDLAFIDGNHRYQPTVNYFNQLLAKSNNYSILILDDIHWSKEMEQAWQYVQDHQAVTMTIDLFFIGIVLLRDEFKIKQHFSVRF